MKTIARILAVLAVLSAVPKLAAEVRLPAILTDNMVLQQGILVPIWGWADEGEQVTVTFQNQRLTTKAKDGKWSVKLKALKATDSPQSLGVTGRNRITLNNILIGEVWVCSGQSNMEWPMSKSFQPENDIKNSTNPNLRLFTVVRNRSNDQLDDLQQSWNVGKFAWQEASPQSVPDFSAVAFYFGRALHQARGVPVGLIHTSWGGSPAEVWMSPAVLDANADNLAFYSNSEAAMKKYKTDLANHQKNVADAKKDKKEYKGQPPRQPWSPSELYNAMLAPIMPVAIKGAIWYQGESNAPRAYHYRTLFTDMIKNWRKDWGQGDFSFLCVQLAPYDHQRRRSIEEITKEPTPSAWAELREAQYLATKSPVKAGMVVITDFGDKDDIHPTKKQPVGERLALAARGLTYGEKIVYSGPIYKTMRVKNNQAILSFDHVGGGLEAKGGKLTGFSICGADQKFVWADAEIVQDTVVVSSPSVDKPVAVRYGWADFPVVNLFNTDGLPASPFRTDDFPMTTAPK